MCRLGRDIFAVCPTPAFSSTGDWAGVFCARESIVYLMRLFTEDSIPS